MAIIPVPAGMTFSKVNSFTLQRASNILRSKFTGQGQRIVYPFAVWMLEATLNETDGRLAGLIRSFLVQLDGQKNSFRLPVPGYYRPSTGFVAYIETTQAVAARASSMLVNGGGDAQAQALFREGDFFTVNDELKMVTADVATNGNSQAVIYFKPPLRKPVGAFTAIKYINPTVLMTAEDDDIASWGIGPPTRQSGKFNAVEAVDI